MIEGAQVEMDVAWRFPLTAAAGLLSSTVESSESLESSGFLILINTPMPNDIIAELPDSQLSDTFGDEDNSCDISEADNQLPWVIISTQPIEEKGISTKYCGGAVNSEQDYSVSSVLLEESKRIESISEIADASDHQIKKLPHARYSVITPQTPWDESLHGDPGEEKTSSTKEAQYFTYDISDYEDFVPRPSKPIDRKVEALSHAEHIRPEVTSLPRNGSYAVLPDSVGNHLESSNLDHPGTNLHVSDIKNLPMVDGQRFIRSDALPNLEMQHVVRQICEKITRVSTGGIEIALDPIELGKVRILISPGENPTVAVVADRLDTLYLLKRNLDLLAKELQESGLSGADISFSSGSDGDDAHSQASMSDLKLLDNTDFQGVPEDSHPRGTKISSGTGLGTSIDIRI